MTNNPNYLDLDAVDADIELVVKLDGKEHKLQPITVEDFVANLKMVQEMGTTADIEKETKMLVSMLARAFPTIGEDRLHRLTLPQLNSLMAKAREFNGEKTITDEVKAQLQAEGQANPPTPTS